jgi:hypothetical protein
MLGVLAVALEPLSPRTLAAILGCDESEVKANRAYLSDFIHARNRSTANQEVTYTFDHFSLQEWLSREDEEGNPRAARFSIDLPAARERIREWALAHVRAGTAHEQLYLLRHLAKHFDEDERIGLYDRLMFNFRWLSALVVEVGIDQAIADCAHIAGTEPGRLLLAALRNSSYWVRRTPRILASQLLGRLADRRMANFDALCTSIRSSLRDVAPALLPEIGSL